MTAEVLLDQQLQHCRSCLDAFADAVRQQRWHELTPYQESFSVSMDNLRSLVAAQPADVAEHALQLRDLEIRVRRLQRQLMEQMARTQGDITMLEQGIRRGDATLRKLAGLALP